MANLGVWLCHTFRLFDWIITSLTVNNRIPVSSQQSVSLNQIFRANHLFLFYSHGSHSLIRMTVTALSFHHYICFSQLIILAKFQVSSIEAIQYLCVLYSLLFCFCLVCFCLYKLQQNTRSQLLSSRSIMFDLPRLAWLLKGPQSDDQVTLTSILFIPPTKGFA